MKFNCKKCSYSENITDIAAFKAKYVRDGYAHCPMCQHPVPVRRGKPKAAAKPATSPPSIKATPPPANRVAEPKPRSKKNNRSIVIAIAAATGIALLGGITYLIVASLAIDNSATAIDSPPIDKIAKETIAKKKDVVTSGTKVDPEVEAKRQRNLLIDELQRVKEERIVAVRQMEKSNSEFGTRVDSLGIEHAEFVKQIADEAYSMRDKIDDEDKFFQARWKVFNEKHKPDIDRLKGQMDLATDRVKKLNILIETLELKIRN